MVVDVAAAYREIVAGQLTLGTGNETAFTTRPPERTGIVDRRGGNRDPAFIESGWEAQAALRLAREFKILSPLTVVSRSKA